MVREEEWSVAAFIYCLLHAAGGYTETIPSEVYLMSSRKEDLWEVGWIAKGSHGSSVRHYSRSNGSRFRAPPDGIVSLIEGDRPYCRAFTIPGLLRLSLR